MASRQYDIVLLGATGYTGKLTAEYIAANLPTNLKWAIGGRSAAKLQDLAGELKSLNADRIQPEIETVQLNADELSILAQKTKIVLNCIGPYHLYSIPVVEACAKTGTHYLDVTGEIPFVKKIIDDFHDLAKSTGAIIIPETGFDSSPSDLIAYKLATLLRETHSVGTKDIITSVSVKGAGFSGGTLATIITLTEAYGLRGLSKLYSPFVLTPARNPQPNSRIPLLTRLLGIRFVPGLGTLTTSLFAPGNTAIVYRSASLMAPVYGPNFHYAEYDQVRNPFFGILQHLAIQFTGLLMAFPPSRWAIKKLVYQPGQGPPREKKLSERLDMRAIAVADQPPAAAAPPLRAEACFAFEGGMYRLTGLLMSEAAMVVLRDEAALRQRLGGGGVFTPATLGAAYVEGVRRAGCVLEAKVVLREQGR